MAVCQYERTEAKDERARVAQRASRSQGVEGPIMLEVNVRTGTRAHGGSAGCKSWMQVGRAQFKSQRHTDATYHEAPHPCGDSHLVSCVASSAGSLAVVTSTSRSRRP